MLKLFFDLLLRTLGNAFNFMFLRYYSFILAIISYTYVFTTALEATIRLIERGQSIILSNSYKKRFV